MAEGKLDTKIGVSVMATLIAWMLIRLLDSHGIY